MVEPDFYVTIAGVCNRIQQGQGNQEDHQFNVHLKNTC